MTDLFPHTSYAEDQPWARTILYLHVSRASAMAGSFASFITAPASLLFSHKTSLTMSALAPRLLTHAYRGFVAGAVLGLGATYGRMMGREDMEWKDRAWRLVENKGEVDTDWWCIRSAAAGGLGGVLAARRGAAALGGVGTGRAVMSGVGLGMASGVPYMVSTFARARGSKPA